MSENALPNDTRDKVLRQQWANLAKTLKGGQRLSKADWELFLELTQELSAAKQAGDPDWFAEAEAAGAYKMNNVPRPTAEQMAARVDRVMQWTTDGKTAAFMLAEAQKLWGIGYHSLRLYRKRAAKMIQDEQKRHAAIAVGTAFARLDNVYRVAMEEKRLGDALSAIDQSVKLAGVVPAQRLELTGADGSALSVFDVPEKEVVPRT